TRVSTQAFEGVEHQAAECPFEDSCLAVFRLTASHVEANIVLHGQNAHGKTEAEARESLDAYTCWCDDCDGVAVSPRLWMKHLRKATAPTPE
ncbi:unnamed protein product, partial [Ectocarpus sp. 12 AP-2014]